MKDSVAAHTACHDSLPTLLSRAAINELLTHRIYSLLIRQPEINSTTDFNLLIHTAHTEDLSHYHDILTCMSNMGITDLPTRIEGKFAHALKETCDTALLLKLSQRAEAALIGDYTEICRRTLDSDFRLFDLSYRNLNNNLLHRKWMSDALASSRVNPS